MIRLWKILSLFRCCTPVSADEKATERSRKVFTVYLMIIAHLIKFITFVLTGKTTLVTLIMTFFRAAFTNELI